MIYWYLLYLLCILRIKSLGFGSSLRGLESCFFVCPFWTGPSGGFQVVQQFCSCRPKGSQLDRKIGLVRNYQAEVGVFLGLESLRNQGNVLTCSGGMFHTFTYVVSVFVCRSTTWFRWGKTWNIWLTAPNSGVPLLIRLNWWYPLIFIFFADGRSNFQASTDAKANKQSMWGTHSRLTGCTRFVVSCDTVASGYEWWQQKHNFRDLPRL